MGGHPKGAFPAARCPPPHLGGEREVGYQCLALAWSARELLVCCDCMSLVGPLGALTTTSTTHVWTLDALCGLSW